MRKVEREERRAVMANLLAFKSTLKNAVSLRLFPYLTTNELPLKFSLSLPTFFIPLLI